MFKRQREPSQLCDANSERFAVPASEISGRRRRDETLQSYKQIHGGTSDNVKPALDGMWLTLVKKSAPKQLLNYVSNSKKVVNKVIGSVVNKCVRDFEVSDVSSMRSVKVLYSNGLMSKEKYKAVRCNLSMSCSITRKKKKSISNNEGC